MIETHLLPAFGDMRARGHHRADDRALDRRPPASAQRQAAAVQPQPKQDPRRPPRRLPARRAASGDCPLNPAAQVERHPQPASGDIDVFTPEEVHALARAADNEQDAAIFAVAAFTGLRMGELRALRWRDVDFAAHVVRVRASYANGVTTTPKSGKVRSVPLVDAAAEWLARLDRARASHDDGRARLHRRLDGGHLSDDRLRWRYGKALERAGLRRAALPRPAPHLRIARDQSRRHRRGPGVDGPCRRQDHDALPALPRPGGCGCSAQCGLHGGPRAR